MPGTTALTVANEHLSTVAHVYLKKEMRSIIDRKRPIVEHALKEGLVKQTGGERVIIPWGTNRSTVTTRVVSGYEMADDTVLPIGTPGHDAWAFVMRPVMISRRDRLINRGPAKQIDIMKTRLKSAEEGMKQEFENVLLRGAAASGSWAGEAAWVDWNTLNGTDDATGFIEEVDPSTNTLHNVAKTSFTGRADFPGFHNPIGDAAGAFGTNGLPETDGLLLQIRELNGGLGSKLKGYCRTAFAENLKRATRSREIYTSADPDPGRPVLRYGGVELFLTDRLPTDGANTATDPWSCVFIDWEDINVVGQTDAIFNLTPFETIPGSGVQIALHDFMGQNVACYLGTSGLLFDGNAWS